MKEKILIIGNSANVYSLAKSLSTDYEIFVAPGSDTMKEFATCIDIREDSDKELLDFVMENDIGLTIPVSTKALNSNIVEFFSKNNQKIFAPSKQTCEIVFDKISIKKLLYKLRIPTPKFGIFEKQNMAMDYIKNLKTPFVIKTNEPSSAVVLTAQNTAKTIIDSLFIQNNPRVLIEDYVWGTPFTFYTITDGYKALPIGSSIIYKHSLEGEGGQLTNGMGAGSPNYKLSIDNEKFLVEKVINPLLNYLNTSENNYLGILGINGILTEENEIQVLSFEPFMQDCDCQSILNIIDTDLIEIINSCLIGSFSDDIDFIPLKERFSTSIVLICNNKESHNNPIIGLENLDENVDISFYPRIYKNKYLEYEAQTGPVVVLTSSGRTASSATNTAYNEVKNILFKGLSYRKDICKPLNAKF